MLAWITFGLALASMILHFVAPRTATTADDKAAQLIDEATPIIKAMLPAAAKVTAAQLPPGVKETLGG